MAVQPLGGAEIARTGEAPRTWIRQASPGMAAANADVLFALNGGRLALYDETWGERVIAETLTAAAEAIGVSLDGRVFIRRDEGMDVVARSGGVTWRVDIDGDGPAVNAIDLTF